MTSKEHFTKLLDALSDIMGELQDEQATPSRTRLGTLNSCSEQVDEVRAMLADWCDEIMENK